MAKTQEKYMLIWVSGTLVQNIAEGTAALLNYKKRELQKHYPTGKLLVISEAGYKYNYLPKIKAK